jgi:hypothetical protein
MRLIILAVSASLLVIGLINNDQSIAIAGGILYVLYGIKDLFMLYHSLKFKQDSEDPYVRISKIKLLSNVLETILLGFSAFLALDGNIAGMIFWFGAICCWVAWGIIIGTITGLPLKMGYSGWYIYNQKKKRKR